MSGEKEDVIVNQDPNESSGTDALQVEIVDDTPPEDRNRPKRTGEPDLPDEDEVAQYSEKVKKRISKLKYEFHEERRNKEELERQQAALADYAKRVINENAALKKALQSGQSIIADQMQSRVESQLEYTKRRLREAIELGDLDKQVEFQNELAKLSVEADKVRSFRPTEIVEEEVQPEPVQQRAPQPDAKTVAWARRNNWFGRDREMTDYARHVHDRLVVFDRVDPKTDEYWNKLDEELHKRYPHLAPETPEGEDEDSRPPAKRQNVVAPVKRGSTPPKKIQLSASEVAIAKRLGLTIEQYAAEKMRSM